MKNTKKRAVFLDRDGVINEVIFHGSKKPSSSPFISLRSDAKKYLVIMHCPSPRSYIYLEFGYNIQIDN